MDELNIIQAENTLRAAGYEPDKPVSCLTVKQLYMLIRFAINKTTENFTAAEQKAKTYYEALKVAKNLISIGLIYEDAAIQIFPELIENKESKDEQSKKWILEYLHDGLQKSDEQFKGQFKAAITWLNNLK